MPDLSVAFREWILARNIDGCTIKEIDPSHLTLTTQHTEAHITFYEVGPNEPKIVEFIITRINCACASDPVFHLHFELTDVERAQELFDEMLDVLLEQGRKSNRKVLLCCTSGLTTTMFAKKLNDTAKTLSLDYTFEAKPLAEAIEEQSPYVAVMLAPQVGYQRNDVVAAYPDVPVFEIPAKIYGAYDAGATIRLLLDALDATKPDVDDLRMVRDIANTKRILIIYVNMHKRRTTIRYRLYEKGKLTLSGRVAKRRVDFRDVDELLGTLRLRGLDFTTVDAVGVVVPGIVDGELATFPATSKTTYDFGGSLQSSYGVRVFAENDANAASVGCYVTQANYDNVSIHIQHAGHRTGGAGSVEAGRLIKGRRGFAGEIAAVQRLYTLPMDIEEARWNPEAVLLTTAAHIVAASCLLAPDAFYVAVDMVPDMDALHNEVAKHLPEGYIPDLIPVKDLRERIFMGMLALTLQRLEAENHVATLAAKETLTTHTT